MAREEHWGSRLGVILAVAGSAVGLGNFLRFPGQAVQHGGGAFMIPYLLAFVLVGVPIGWVEWTLGRYGGSRGWHSAPGILGMAGRAWARYVGVLGVLIPLGVYFYYLLIESWCLRYAFEYAVRGVPLGGAGADHAAESQALFGRFSGAAGDGVLFRDGIDVAVVFWLVVMVINLIIIFRGVAEGIERFCRWAMPLMAVCAVAVLVRVLTLGTPDPALPDQNVVNGLGFMWNPTFSKLGDFETWLAAAGQIFFSLSVGFGVIINYASYLRRKQDVVLSSLTASSTNELFEVGFGGLITVTAAFVFLGASGAVGGTFGLGFNTLPVVFLHMGALGRIVGVVWFSMLFLAAITSSLSMLQPVTAFAQEALGMPRSRAVVGIGLLATFGSFWVLYFSGDLMALDTLDFWVGTLCLPLLALVQVFLFGWVLGIDRGMAEAARGAEIRIPPVFGFIIKYVSPTFLLIVIGGFCVQNLPDRLRGLADNPVARNTVLLIVSLIVLLILIVWRAHGRWQRETRGGAAPAWGDP